MSFDFYDRESGGGGVGGGNNRANWGATMNAYDDDDTVNMNAYEYDTTMECRDNGVLCGVSRGGGGRG